MQAGTLLNQVLPEIGLSIEDGLSVDTVRYLISQQCNQTYSGESVELCTHFLVSLYNLTEGSDQDRLRGFLKIMSKYLYTCIAT